MRRVWLAAVLVLAACGVEQQPKGGGIEGDGALARALRAASEETGVPVELLAVRGWQASRFAAQPLDEGHGEGRRGVLGMSPAAFERAAALAQVTPDALAADVTLELKGYARLLAELRASPDWPGWAAAAVVASGVDGLSDTFAPAREELLLGLAGGVEVQLGDGERLTVHPVELGFEVLSSAAQALTPPAPGEYPAMGWYAANPNNYLAGRPAAPRYVVIHDMEGSFWGSVSWFQQANPYQASAHYMIRSSDGYIVQMVGEANTSWHAGNDYYSRASIGIEHEGYASAPSTWFTEAMYQSSARLVCAIARKYGIPVDSQHIIGHFQIPNPSVLASSAAPGTLAQTQATPYNYGGISNHFDPGRGGTGWRWDYYLGLVKGCVDAANGVTAGSGSIACQGAVCWATATLKLNNDSKPVYLLKQNLVLLGHLGPGAGKSTRFDAATKDAVSALQRAASLGESGTLDASTATALKTALLAKSYSNVPSADVEYGQTSANVTTLQSALTRLGFSVPATGYYGDLTRQAVLDFQTRQKVPGGDGAVCGSMTRMALAAALARGLGQ
ncbi:MAG: N-acetylmuramoyl-L-alanine amidase [Archangiaceae bacterium]|nr:N-acetylmuramoyl-L-alanine amidase [Archangiaceae bacterium]